MLEATEAEMGPEHGLTHFAKGNLCVIDAAKARGEQASAAELYRGAGDLMAVGFGEGHPYVIECRAKAPRPGSYFPPLR